MNKALLYGVVALCIGTAPKASHAAGPIGRIWSFENEARHALPAGWHGMTGIWRVEPASDAPSGPNVLAQISDTGRGGHFNVAIAPEPHLRDLELDVKLRAVAGHEDQGGGLVWRFRDLKNYYIARHNPLENNYRLYKVVDGHRRQLATAEVEAPLGVWHDMRITMKGPLIKCFLDGRKHLTAEDETFKEPGRFGLWTKADARTQFDDLRAEGE